MGYLLDDLIAICINADQGSILTAAQVEGKWRKTAKQGAKCFMLKCIADEEVGARLRYAVVRPNVPGRTNDKIAYSKRVIVFWRYVWFLFIPFSPFFRFHLSGGPSFNRSSIQPPVLSTCSLHTNSGCCGKERRI